MKSSFGFRIPGNTENCKESYLCAIGDSETTKFSYKSPTILHVQGRKK